MSWFDQAGGFEWLSTVPGTPDPRNGYDRLERLYKINKEPQNYNYDALRSALDRGTSMSWRDSPAGQDYVNDWLARRQSLLSQQASASSEPKSTTKASSSSSSSSAPKANVPGAPSPAPGTSGKSSSGKAELIDGLTPAEFDLKAKLDILRETGNIDTQIKNMELEAAENLTKLSNVNKLSLADRAVNQSLMSTLVGAFNF